MLLRISAIAALMLLAIWGAVRYRFVRVEKIEVVDKEVQAILEQAADTLSMNSFRRNNALFLSSTENSFYLFSSIPCEFDLQWETAGMTSSKSLICFCILQFLVNPLNPLFEYRILDFNLMSALFD